MAYNGCSAVVKPIYIGVNGLNQDEIGACNCLQARRLYFVAGLRTLAREVGHLFLDCPDGLIEQYIDISIFRVKVNDFVT